jgi:feruloyl esterase
VIDFGYRAVHEASVNAKRIIAAYYNRSASHAYFSSCSDGGSEALMEAQRYPQDYDGIIAGAPVSTGPTTSSLALHGSSSGSPIRLVTSPPASCLRSSRR